MERLKSIVPDTLKRKVAKSTSNDLASACSSLLHLFHHSPLFHQVVGELTDPETALCQKDKKAALDLKLKGNKCFSNGDYTGAVQFYSQALRVAPSHVDDIEKDLLAMLYVNRAASFHKMGLLAECLRDCRRAIVNSPSYAKAWFRRGKANACLGNYEGAIRDFKIAKEMELSSTGRRQIESELRTVLHQLEGSSGALQSPNRITANLLDEPNQIELQCDSIPNKGRGMVSTSDIAPSSLVHKEDPYAAILFKHCRETHCHYCFNELPPDTVPCISCSIPLYCSERCLEQAGGEFKGNIQKSDVIHESLSDDLKEYIIKVSSISLSGLDSKYLAEHRHECKGVHWPAVLPSDIVLAGRVLVNYIEEQKHCSDVSHLSKKLNLCQNYDYLPSESRLEFHIYSIILMYCLQFSYCSELTLDGHTASQIVIILSQIRVNSMAIVRMKVFDVNRSLIRLSKFHSADEASTDTVEQVKVGQAIYLAGSLFNHSCKPNIHAYFFSRTLYIRATEFVPAGSQLELSYGPQVGQQDCRNRQQFLEDLYSFSCQCTGCSQLNLSDLVISAYRCIEPSCAGVVLDNSTVKYEKRKLNHFLAVNAITKPPMQDNELSSDGTLGVDYPVFENIGSVHHCEPACCLNCGTYHDLEASYHQIQESETYLQRLQDAVNFNEVSPHMFLDGLEQIDLLRRTLHPLNKRIAEAEDNLAQAHCLAGELRAAVNHCQSSIKILEKLYDPNHIAIGNEFVKLASVQLSLDDSSVVDSVHRVTAIFSRYYGSHMDVLFPYLQTLERDSAKYRG